MIIAHSASSDLGLSEAAPGDITPPPGELPTNGQIVVVAELSKGTSFEAAEAALRASGARIIYRTQLAYRGIAVQVAASGVSAIRATPGIAAAHLLPAKQRLRSRATTITKLSLPSYAAAPSTGAGARIGIIDSGIDYTHATFGGAGTPAAFDANDPTTIEPGSFPTGKVIGGYDLAGDGYDADGDSASSTPAPDADPLDCRADSPAVSLNRGGHGTHVAATAAGYGVVEGRTYSGPYDSTLDPTTFELLPGVAPQASLFALKVFGCRGTTVLIARAIEMAIDPNGDGDTSDRAVDVLNIAIGAPFGSADDPDARAVDAAVRAGVTVVVAVGDTGDAFSVASSPATATGAIAVGALSGSLPASFSARGPQRGGKAIKPDIVAPGVAIRSAAAGSGSGTVTLDGTSSAAAQVAGAAAVIKAAHTDMTPAQIKAALLNTATPLSDSSGQPLPGSLSGAGELNLAALGSISALAYVAGEPAPGSLSFGSPWVAAPLSTSQQLTLENHAPTARVVRLSIASASAMPGVSVSVPDAPIELPAHSQTRVPVSVSIAPAELDNLPGALTPLSQGILSRYWMTERGGQIQISSGGDVARVRGIHAALGDGLRMTIDDTAIAGQISAGEVSDYQVALPGTRTVRIWRAGADAPVIERALTIAAGTDYSFMVYGKSSSLKMTVIAAPRGTPAAALIQFTSASPGEIIDVCINDIPVVSVAYGQASPLIAIGTDRQTITFYRRGEYSAPLAVATIDPAAGETLLAGVSQGSSACQPHGCTPAQLAFSAAARNETQPELSLRVPFQIYPKSASRVSAASPMLSISPSATSLSLSLQNSGARNQPSSLAGAQTPLTAAFELYGESPQTAPAGSSLSAADLRYVGVSSNYPIAGPSSRWLIFFATASYGPWSTPSEVQHRIYLDTTGPLGVPDGIDDYLLVNSSLGSVTTQLPNDAFVSLLYRVQPDGSLVWTRDPLARYNSLPPPSTDPTAPAGLDMAPFRASAMLQMLVGRQIGLSESQPLLRFRIETRARDASNFSDVVDRVPATGQLEYNLTSAAIYPVNSRIQQRPLFISTGGATLEAVVSPAALAARGGSQRLLLLHLHNPISEQAELVTVTQAP